MKTILIGFKISEGEMVKNGEKVAYNSRTVRFISDMGSNDEDIGFSPFEQKFKLAELAKILGVNPNSHDVNDALMNMVNKAVICQYAPVFGVLQVVGFVPEKNA